MTTKSGECSRNVASINRNYTHSGGLDGSSDGEKNSGNSSSKYRGVRKRNWGKWVSEIRLPNSRERIWLGSFDSPEKAARAFDAAVFCLRGPTAKFNFPDNPPHIPGGTFLSPAEIQGAAAEYANSEPRVGQSDPCCWSSELQQVDCTSSQSPSYLVSDVATGLDMAHMAVDTDTSVFNQYSRMGSGWTDNRVPDFGIFPGFDDLSNEFFLQPRAPDYEEACPEYTTTSFLWNF